MYRFFRNTIRLMATEDSYTNQPQKCKGGGVGANVWRAISLFLAIPTVIVMSVYNHLVVGGGHFERPPFVQYEYLRIRNKRYPWGDGTRTFFHNPERNPLPTGWEEIEEKEDDDEEEE